MRKIISLISIFMCLSGVSLAMDFRQDRPYLHIVGWDQRSLEKQTQGAVYLRAQISKLEEENEQLRNSISNIREKDNNKPYIENDPRIQALIEENNRLSHLLNKKDNPNDYAAADVYAQKIYAIEAENKKLQDNNSINYDMKYQKELELYKQDNARLKSTLTEVMSDSADILELRSAVKDMKISIYERQEENRKLSRALAKSSTKNLNYYENIDTAKNDNAASAKTIDALKAKINQMQKDNEALNSKVIQSSQVRPISNIAVLQSLKKQNQSLRETITAQNKVLVSSDNAAKTAERLLTENTVLKRKLYNAGQASTSNDKSVKELFVHNEKLQAEIIKRNDYISRLVGLKETVKQLRIENDKYALGQVTSKYVNDQIDVLQGDNRALNHTLNKERENIKILEKKYNDKTTKVTELQLEKQELNARIKLLSTKKGEENISIKNTDTAYDDKKVTLIDAPYPPVDQVAPILDMDGSHIKYKSKTLNAKLEDDVSSLPEKLLAQGIKPLSDLNN